MQIVHNMNIHLDRREQLPPVEAVQGETGRAVAVTLYEKGQLWPVPPGAQVAVRYGKPDLTGGIYDTLPDGEKACTIDGSTVTVALPAQMLAVAGIVTMQLMVCAEGAALATFSIGVRVEPDPSAGTEVSEDYVNLLPEAMEAAQLSLDAAERARASADAAHESAQQARILAASVTSRYDLNYTPHWVDETTGELVSSNVTITSSLFPVLGGAVGVAFGDNIGARLCYYDRGGAFLGKDSLCFDSFRRTGLTAAFARVEAIYANGATVEDIPSMAESIAVYVPAAGLEDVERAVMAGATAQEHANYAFHQAQRAEDAADRAQKLVGSGTGCAISPDIANYSDSECFTVKVQPASLGGTALSNFGSGNWSAMASTPTTKSAYMFSNKAAAAAGRLQSVTVRVAGVGNLTLAIAHITEGTVTGVDTFTAYADVTDGPCTLVNGVDFSYDGRIAPGDLVGVDLSTNTVNKLFYGTSDTDWCYQTASLTDYTLTPKTYGFAVYATVEVGGETSLTLEKSELMNTSATRQVCFVNFSRGVMGFYERCADGDDLTVFSARPISFPLTAGHEYVVQMIKRDSDTATLRLTDGNTLVSDEITCPAYNVGRGWGTRRCRFVDGGTVKQPLSTGSHILQRKHTRLLIVGDSLIEGNSLPENGEDRNDRYAMRIKNALGGDCFINSRGGASSANVQSWFNSYLPQVCVPEYTILAVGHNDSDFEGWMARYQALIAKVEAMGSIPVPVTLVASPNAPCRDIFPQQNEWIRSCGYDYIDANRITSLDQAGEAVDPALFYEDLTHLNALGHQKVFLRAQLDVPYLFG